ncbi:cyclin-H isoform X3 [Brachyhypopomus gauderio]|uniref:cyclin-H isoform X3 n=1 Tax=Brachyhypopomus gauderio TaxID=698409 RepID=UPI0040412473
MYHNSSQKKYWIFDKEATLDQFRYEANQKFRSKALALRKGTACMYFRRFYLNNSLMEYHPRTIMLTCAYLSCKVDEFNVSSTQFVGNLQESPAGQERALEQILEYELLLIQQLNFHLVVHNPYRPMEGFLIDLKTRYPLLENPEVLRKSADDFLNRATTTDAGLLFSPSQIALTAVLNSAARAGLTMETYLTECMGLKEDKETLSKMYDAMRRLTTLIKEYELPKVDEVNVCKQKLERIHAECATNTHLKRKHGYEDDDHVVKKPLVTEEVRHDFLTLSVPLSSFHSSLPALYGI